MRCRFSTAEVLRVTAPENQPAARGTHRRGRPPPCCTCPASRLGQRPVCGPDHRALPARRPPRPRPRHRRPQRLAGPHDRVEDAALLVTELATNAVQHGTAASCGSAPGATTTPCAVRSTTADPTCTWCHRTRSHREITHPTGRPRADPDGTADRPTRRPQRRQRPHPHHPRPHPRHPRQRPRHPRRHPRRRRTPRRRRYPRRPPPRTDATRPRRRPGHPLGQLHDPGLAGGQHIVWFEITWPETDPGFSSSETTSDDHLPTPATSPGPAPTMLRTAPAPPLPDRSTFASCVILLAGFLLCGPRLW
jgi:hypothetical protein